MLDLQTQRKTKIVLGDYDYRRDLENRVLMSRFSDLDVMVLEELLYSSVHISVHKMARSLELEEKALLEILFNLSKTGLLSINGDQVEVDKDVRKYFETQILKFEEDFKPGVDYLLSLLRKVPIHILPAWYSVPRTSNNIFESIIERYLSTPQVYYRYLQDFYLYHPHLTPLLKDLFSSPKLKLTSQEVIERYSLDREQFEETVLLLEFSFVACLRYEKIGNQWKEYITPFDEWSEYLSFLRTTQPTPILDEEEIIPLRPHDFSFVRDMSKLLKMAKLKPISLKEENALLIPSSKAASTALSKQLGFDLDQTMYQQYFSRLVLKMRLMKLADVGDGELSATTYAQAWLDMEDEEKAMFLYRNSLNRLVSQELKEPLFIDKSVREAEKSIQRVLNAGWVKLEDIIKGAIVSFTEEPAILLKKQGRQWKYARPDYTNDQLQLIRAVVHDWLFESGAVSVGRWNGERCFKVTAFGHSIFGH
jgi:predicted transcriptional regulator